jgi:hypothetical protein
MVGAGAGTYYQRVLVVNRSGHTCTVTGFPRLVALDSNGRPILPIPTNGLTTTIASGRHPRKIALEPGGAAAFELNITDAANYSRSACLPRKAATLRISVPSSGSGTSLVPFDWELCTTGSNARVGRIE